MASDFGLIYTLNNQFMAKSGKDLAFGKGSLEIKVFFVVKLMLLKYMNIAHISIILFVSYTFYSH